MGNDCSVCRGEDADVVVVDHDFDYCDHTSGKHKVSALDQAAVHGRGVDTLAKHRQSLGFCDALACETARSGDTFAASIVQRAKTIAEIVGREKTDILDSDWTVQNGRSPLSILFDSDDMVFIGTSIKRLCKGLIEMVASEPTMNETQSPAKVFGDIHGQFRDMLLFLHDFGFPHGAGPVFVFNGDWVDRGKHQLESISLVFALKLALPDHVWLNRGNHEDPCMNQSMGPSGFAAECVRRLGQETGTQVFQAIAEVYEWLPLGTLIDERILCVHGGLGDGQWSLEDLRTVQRPLGHEALAKNHMVYNVLWSDPIPEDERDCNGVHDSPRDNHAHLVLSFGPDVTADFCEHNGLDMVIRSHQCLPKGKGYEVLHDGHCMRVFSARNYEGNNNDASILSICQNPGEACLTVRPQVLLALKR